MNRINQIFQDLRRRRDKALMPFITAGDPDLVTTAALLPALERAGASVCELGIAFSDPIADGPVIQDSMAHALRCDVRPWQVLEMVSQIRPKVGIGLVAMVSYSIVYRLGPKSFIGDAKQAGIDGFIFPDLPVDEADAVRDMVLDAGLIVSFLIAPSTPIERAKRIATASSGFVYLMSRRGLTGERSELPPELPDLVTSLRELTDLPIAVGFGISTAQQVQQVASVADAAIVGSAVMRRLLEHREATGDVSAGTPSDTTLAVARVESFVAELASGLKVPPRP